MFFFKEDRRTLEQLKKIVDNYVECSECGVLIDKQKAKKVFRENVGFSPFLSSLYERRDYCSLHRPPYDKVVCVKGNENTYYRSDVEVDIKGNIKK